MGNPPQLPDADADLSTRTAGQLLCPSRLTRRHPAQDRATTRYPHVDEHAVGEGPANSTIPTERLPLLPTPKDDMLLP